MLGKLYPQQNVFLLHVWVEFKVVPWRTEHILKFHLPKCGCKQISDYFVAWPSFREPLPDVNA